MNQLQSINKMNLALLEMGRIRIQIFLLSFFMALTGAQPVGDPCTVTVGGTSYNGKATYQCDPRCHKYSSDKFCCLSQTQISNYDCLYACNTDSTSTGVGNVYLWSDGKRCEDYCPTRFYVPSTAVSGDKCLACDPLCLQCDGPYNYNCLSCDTSSYRLNATGCYNVATHAEYSEKNPCPNGYYGVQIKMICTACPTGCSICAIFLTWEMPGTNFATSYNQGGTNCTGDSLCGYTVRCYGCIGGYTLLQGICYSNSQCFTYSYNTAPAATFNPSSCKCFTNYMLLGLSICKKCHISCQTCSGINSNQCITCPLGSNYTTALPTTCTYNSTFQASSPFQTLSTHLPLSTTVNSNGFYMIGSAPVTGVNQRSCDKSIYVFGYYGYNNKGLSYYSIGLAQGLNLFPDGAAIVYNKAVSTAHYGIHLRGTLLFIDQWKNGLKILFQQNSINRFHFTYQMQGIAGQYLCGLNYDDHLDVFDDWFPHTSNAISNLRITASNNKYAWGIKQLVIRLLVCHSSCSTCTGPGIADCASCPANQTVSNKVCVCDSSLGFYNNSGTCSTSCGTLFKNNYTSTCESTCTWPYAFSYNGSCYISCPANYYKNYSNNACVNQCYLNVTTITADKNYYKFDGIDRICNNSCPTGTFGDPLTGTCVTRCPTYDKNSTFQFNNISDDGFFASGGFCYQICPNSNQFAFVPTRTCLTSCPSGYFKNYKSKINGNFSFCEQQCSVSLLGAFKYGDNTTGYCTDYCSSGSYGDIATHLCVKTCNSTAFSLQVQRTAINLFERLCVINCTDGFYGNTFTGFCVLPKDCPTNYYADTLTFLCTNLCSGLLYFGNNQTKKCDLTCPTGAFKDNQTKVCLKTCLSNDTLVIEYGDPQTNYCVAKCFGAYYADDQHNYECVLICSASPSSTFGLNNVCLKNCSNTTYADFYNPARICTTQCFGNSSLQSYGLNSTRTCVLNCPDYQFAYYSNFAYNVTLAGTGLCLYGCPVNPDTSSAGLFGNILNNKCEQKCPQPYYGDQTGNRTCVKKCPWPYFGQDCTQGGTLASPTFTYSSFRQCQLVCACGWADNSSQTCVWNSSGCANFTFAHQDNHKCVVAKECVGFADPVSRYCINPCFKSATVLYFADNQTKSCVLVCPDSPDYYGDNVTQACVSVCPNTTVRDPQNDRRCVSLNNCSKTFLNLYGDQLKDLCVVALNCSDGYYADNNSKYCVSVCPGPTLFYADNVTKQCVSLCELGWYSLNISSGKGICSRNCPANLWADNLTVSCTSRCSSKTYGVNYTTNWDSFNTTFNISGICMAECPNGQFARDADNLCVSNCGPGLWGDTLSKTCKTSPSDCPSGYYADNTKNMCVVPLNCSIVSSVQYVADNLTKSCVVKCPNSSVNYADMNKYLCVARCPTNYYGQNDTLRCQLNCTYPNVSNYDGSYADPQLSICVKICTDRPISTFGQNVTFTCVEPMYCPTDTWAETTVYDRRCYNPCPPPNTRNSNAQMYGDNITRTCVTSCPKFTFADLSQGFGLCVNECPSLINGTLQFADNSTKKCVTVCPIGNKTFGDNKTLSCVYTCPPGSYAQPLPYRYCVWKCSTGTWGENVKRTCVDSPLLCPIINGTLYYGENITTMCVQTCPQKNLAQNVTVDYWGQNTTRLCLPTCLLTNGIQSGYKWNKTRICIDICPAQIGVDGSYSDQGMCYYVCMTANYYRDPQYQRSCQSNCTFSPIKQYADPTTMRCVAKCPTFPEQLYAYDATKQCLNPCPNSYRIYDALKTCVLKCPNDTFFNPDTYKCVSECPLTTSTSQKLYGDPSLNQPTCVTNTNCATDYFGDDIIGLCVKNCTQGQWKYGKLCVQICPDGLYGHPTSLFCVSPFNCPTGYFADNLTVSCVKQCPGTFADSNSQSCVFKCPIINTTVIFYADPWNRICSTSCSNTTFIDLIRNDINQTCVSECAPGLFMDPFLDSCKSQCTQNYYADNSTRTCVKVCPSVPVLFGENETHTCVQSCLNGTQFKDLQARVCVRICPDGRYRDNITRQCQYTCTGFTYADDTTKNCVFNCSPNYSYDPSNICRTSCPSPYFKDPTTFKCVQDCPTSPVRYFKVVQSSTERRCDLNCPNNQFRNFQTFECVTSCPASPITFADTTSRNCLAVCSPGFFGYQVERTCIDKCPTGMFTDPLTRRCVNKCDPVLGYFGDPNINTPACVKVCAPDTYADPYTQTCVYSCIDSPKMYRFYNGDTTNPVRTCVFSCPYPYVADNVLSTCRIVCNSTSLPYVDQSLQICVSKCTTPVYQYSYMPSGQVVNGNCVKFCPSGTFALLTNNSCVSKCPNDYYGSTTNNTCFSTCTLADNYYADPYDNRCVAQCYHTSTYFSYADEFSRKCVRTCPEDHNTFGDKLIWRCVQRCSSLSQFAESIDRTCVTQCPPGTFADSVSQTCVSNCSISTLSYGDTSTRVCVSQCLTTTLYADDSTRLCVNSSSCPSGYFGLNSSRICVASCPTTPDLFGDPVSKTCVYGCAATYYADYVSRTCVLVCPSVPALYAENLTQRCVTTCPPDTFADNQTRTCVSLCSNNTFADNSTYQCVPICPTLPDSYALDLSRRCVQICPSSPKMYADNSTRSCVYECPKGLINTFGDDSSRKCVDICPGNTYNENSTQTCVSLCLTGYADPKTKFCIAICPSYTYGDNSTKRCVTNCPYFNNTQTYAEDGNNLCMSQCLVFFKTFRDNTTKRCVKICPINESLFAQTNQRLCMLTCPTSPMSYADFSTRYCVSRCPQVPALFSISNTNRVCVAVCPNTTWSDNRTRSCLTRCITTPETFGDNSTWACVANCPMNPNTYADSFSNLCVPVCPQLPDLYGDNVTRKCISFCPNNTFADPVSRRCVTTCPLGYYAQNTSRRCVDKCPWKQFADNLTRICLAKCSVDPIFYGNPDNLRCVSQCPQSNNSFGNPVTQQCVNYQIDGTSGCPVSFFADNVSRLCVKICPMKNDTYADSSTWKCVVQCPGGIYNTFSDNSTMRCVEKCPSYPDFYAQSQSRRCVHYCLKPTSSFTGSFSDNYTRTCTEKCPSYPDYYSDNSTGRCVFYCPRSPLTFADNQTRRCVTTCPDTPDIYGDLKTLRCVPQCPRDQDTYADYSTRLCVSTCPSDPSLYADNITLRCVSKCPNGSYADNHTRRCVKVCPRYPQTYADPSTNRCVPICPISPDLYADPTTQACVSRCPSSFYAENNTRKCLSTCLYNSTNFADNLTNRCVEKCPKSDGTYGQNQTQTCVKQCPSQPMTYADDITQMCVVICPNISNGGYADNITRACVSKCPDFSYGDITTRYCVRYCPKMWYAYSIDNLCVSYCPSPYFGDNSTWRCVLQCPKGQILFGQKINNTCVFVCPEGTYASQQYQQCVTRCPNSSQTLRGYNTWGYNVTNECVAQCPFSNISELYGYPVDQVCVSICPDPYYSNVTDHLCYRCPLECASCGYPELCYTCIPNRFLYSGSCVASCPTFPQITYANPNGVCGSAFQCTQGFYALNISKSCVRTCPAGHYVNIPSQTCDPCMRGCLVCTTSLTCISCNTNVSVWSDNRCWVFCSAKNRFYGPTGCVARCPRGMYLNITTCRNCSSSCKTCIVTAENCLTCADGFYSSNGICVSTCPKDTAPRVINNGTSACVSCAVTSCDVAPLTFTTTQFSKDMQYIVQILFSEVVNITEQIDKVIQLKKKRTGRLLASSFEYMDYIITDLGNGLYEFTLKNYNPSGNEQIEIQILNPGAIVGPSGQIPSTTRSSFAVQTSLIFNLSDYNPQIDGLIQSIGILSFVLLILTFGMQHSIWMPMYDYLQLIMALIFINVNFPPNLLYSIIKSFTSSLNFLPNFFTNMFSRAFYDKKYISNNIYTAIEDSSFLRVLGPLYFILLLIGVALAGIFILRKKSPNKQIKGWAKDFLKQTLWRKNLHGFISLFFFPVFMLGLFNMKLYSFFNSQAIQGFSIFSGILFMILFLIPIIFWLYKLRRTVMDHPIVYLMLRKAYNFITYPETVLIQNKNNSFTHDKNEVDLSNARQPRINQLLIFYFPIQTKVGPWEITQPFFNYLHKFITAVILVISFDNPIIQLIMLILINICYLVYISVVRPFYKIKNRQYNNEMYIHNLTVVSLIEIILLVLAFLNNQITSEIRVLVGNCICAVIIEGAIVNIVYFIFRTYNFHHDKSWKPFVRSQMFRTNYTLEHLQWTKEYDENEKKLISEVPTRNEFLQAIKVDIKNGQALANLGKEFSISTSTKNKIKGMKLRPNKGQEVTKQYQQIMKNITNDKQKSHKSLASSERLSKMQRKKLRDLLFSEKQKVPNTENEYIKLNLVEQKQNIIIQQASQIHSDNQQTEYEYQIIEQEYPQGTPMDEILQGCKKGDVVLPI